VLGHWVPYQFSPPSDWLKILADDLRGDLKLIWDDFQLIGRCRRPDKHTGSYKEYLVVAAISRDSIDLIFSKYGYRPNHHFFHWQAVSEGVEGVHVDDYLLTMEEVNELLSMGSTQS
jgi:hypothetical protein